MAKGKLISKLAQAAIKPKKPSARTAKELAAKKSKSKAANATRIARAGQAAIAPQRVAEVRKGASGVVGKNKKGLKPVGKMNKVEKQDYDFEGFNKGLQRELIGKARRGEKATYKGTDYTFMLSEKRGVKPEKVGGKTVKKNAGGVAAMVQAKMAENKKEKGEMAKLGPKTLGYGGVVFGAEKKKDSPDTKKTYGGSFQKGIKKKMGGKVSKPKGVGCATRGYGKAMK